MSSNEKQVFSKYSNQCEEGRAYKSRADSLEFYFTKKLLEKYIDKQSKVIEIGCGTGYYGLFLHDKCKEYIGIDITPENISLFNEKIQKENISNIYARIGDVTNLININNDEFDVVLVFGPMYHLPPEEREIAFEESKRICKKNGIIMYAYQSKFGAYLQAGILSYPNHYPNKKTNEYVLKKETDDENPELFYFTTPNEIKECAKTHGLEVIKNIGVNFYFNKEQINTMDNEKYECWLEFSEYLCNDESCTGLSNHSILICRKRMITSVYFIRHAESDNSIRDGRIRPLTEKGHSDCNLVTDYLSDKNIDIVFSSPFKRAIDTITGFSLKSNLKIHEIEDFRERKSDSDWNKMHDNFFLFIERQWADFKYTSSDGECLADVQKRNINALKNVLTQNKGKNIVIGTHGTALSTIINYYDSNYGFKDFMEMVNIMPWVVKMSFDENNCISIEKINLFEISINKQKTCT